MKKSSFTTLQLTMLLLLCSTSYSSDPAPPLPGAEISPKHDLTELAKYLCDNLHVHCPPPSTTTGTKIPTTSAPASITVTPSKTDSTSTQKSSVLLDLNEARAQFRPVASPFQRGSSTSVIGIGTTPSDCPGSTLEDVSITSSGEVIAVGSSNHICPYPNNPKAIWWSQATGLQVIPNGGATYSSYQNSARAISKDPFASKIAGDVKAIAVGNGCLPNSFGINSMTWDRATNVVTPLPDLEPNCAVPRVGITYPDIMSRAYASYFNGSSTTIGGVGKGYLQADALSIHVDSNSPPLLLNVTLNANEIVGAIEAISADGQHFLGNSRLSNTAPYQATPYLYHLADGTRSPLPILPSRESCYATGLAGSLPNGHPKYAAGYCYAQGISYTDSLAVLWNMSDPALITVSQLSARPASPLNVAWSQAYDISETSYGVRVVGELQNDVGEWHAFVWDPASQLRTINSFASNLGWNFLRASAIEKTEARVIVGSGMPPCDGSTCPPIQGFVLTLGTLDSVTGTSLIPPRP